MKEEIYTSKYALLILRLLCLVCICTSAAFSQPKPGRWILSEFELNNVSTDTERDWSLGVMYDMVEEGSRYFIFSADSVKELNPLIPKLTDVEFKVLWISNDTFCKIEREDERSTEYFISYMSEDEITLTNSEEPYSYHLIHESSYKGEPKIWKLSE